MEQSHSLVQADCLQLWNRFPEHRNEHLKGLTSFFATGSLRPKLGFPLDRFLYLKELHSVNRTQSPRLRNRFVYVTFFECTSILPSRQFLVNNMPFFVFGEGSRIKVNTTFYANHSANPSMPVGSFHSSSYIRFHHFCSSQLREWNSTCWSRDLRS